MATQVLKNNYPICVLAGDRKQFVFWLHENNLTEPRDAYYVYRPELVLGTRASKILVIGTFFERSDAYDMLKFVEDYHHLSADRV